MGLWHWFVQRRRDRNAEREAIEQTQDEMRRAGDEEEPQEEIGSSVYPYMSGDM